MMNLRTNHQMILNLRFFVRLITLISFVVSGGIIFTLLTKEDHYLSRATLRNLDEIEINKNSNEGFYSKIAFNENYIGLWKRLSNSSSSFPHSISGNAKILFNLELTSDKQYDFNAKFLIYENSKAFINTFLFSKHNNSLHTPLPQNHSVMHYENLFEGEIISLINDKHVFSNGMGNCTGYLTLNFSLFNDSIQGKLTTGNCSINLQYDVKKEDKRAKSQNISFYTTILSIIIIISIIAQLAFAIQIEGNTQRSNSLCLVTVALNMIWTVYNIYSNFFLLYINLGYFYQFLLPMILFLFHFGCDMKVWILSIETKYNDTRYISLLTFLALTLSFSSYFLGLGLYFEKNYIIIKMTMIWLPQIIYNIVYYNTSLFPLFYMMALTAYRIFIPLYFCSKELNFVEVKEDSEAKTVYLGIVIISLIVLLCQYAFGSRWFIPYKAYRERGDTLYRKRNEMKKLLPGADSIQCAICLNELFIDKTIIFHQDFIDGNEWRRSLNCNKVKLENKSKMNLALSLLFSFNKRSNIQRRNYMLTQCNHAFHSSCLELWLELKQDCPNCRRKISK